MLVRLIAPQWSSLKPRVIEGELSSARIQLYNSKGYNCYFFPNGPKNYQSGVILDGTMIDDFQYVFVDFDLKSNTYDSKNSFIEAVISSGIKPSQIVDSGNGVHVYWKIQNLDAMSYLRFQRRLCRLYNTDEATTSILQLMRLPGTMNTKLQTSYVPCVESYSEYVTYTAEEFDKLLPPITMEDETSCKLHYERTHSTCEQTTISDKLPDKFGKLLRENNEAKEIFTGNTDDRSKSDFRLGHLLLANNFTRDEALSVLVNSAKTLSRAPSHRQSYAENIVDKVGSWVENNSKTSLIQSVKDILESSGSDAAGKRFPCYSWIDDTECGFRLGHVMGLVAGSGVGKTAVALNLFMGFVQCNPDYDHIFVPLEQTGAEIAIRWRNMCGDNKALYNKVHVISNYTEDGVFRDLSLKDIEEQIIEFKQSTGRNIGCVVIDHIGVLSNNDKMGQDEGVKKIAKAMKGMAVRTNTFMIMQSQTSREKAGIGDLELNKDAAFGTSVFENFCDWLVTVWQPLKRCHHEDKCPIVTALKFCKIRHKNTKKDKIQEDLPYNMIFDTDTELMRHMTQNERLSFKYFLTKATNKRKADRKTDLVVYHTLPGVEDISDEKRH